MGLEVFGGLVGVGAVGGQDRGGQAELGQRGEGVDGVGAGAFAAGVQDGPKRELRVVADALPAASVGGGDGQGQVVAEDAFGGAGAEVPAAGGLHRPELAVVAGWVVPGGDAGGVDADVAGPAPK